MKQTKIFIPALAEKINTYQNAENPYSKFKNKELSVQMVKDISDLEKLLPVITDFGNAYFEMSGTNPNLKIVVHFPYSHVKAIISPCFLYDFNIKITGAKKGSKDEINGLFRNVFTMENPNTIVTKVYSFDELSDDAKNNAIERFRDGNLDYDWWDFTYMDAKNIGLKLTTFDLDRNRHAKGEFVTNAIDCANKIVSEHGKDCETFKTATSFLSDLKVMEHKKQLAHNNDDDDLIEVIESEITDRENEFLQSLLEDYSIMLQKEYEYLYSDEAVLETINANDYTFDINGKMI